MLRVSTLKIASMTSSKDEAVTFKNEGNKAFAAHDWPKAIDLYTKAIEKDDTVAAYYSNRAQVSSQKLWWDTSLTYAGEYQI